MNTPYLKTIRRLGLVLAALFVTVLMTGCDETTGSSTYHRMDGRVTQVNYDKNVFTGNRTVRVKRYGNSWEHQQDQRGEAFKDGMIMLFKMAAGAK